MSGTTTTTKFTEDEEKRIEAAVEDFNKKVREAEIEAEINNRIFEAQRQQPGYKYS